MAHVVEGSGRPVFLAEYRPLLNNGSATGEPQEFPHPVRGIRAVNGSAPNRFWNPTTLPDR